MRVLLSIFFIAILSSCDSPRTSKEVKATSTRLKNEFVQLTEASDKLIITKHFIPQDSNILRSSTNIVKIDSITDTNKIKALGSLFAKSEDMGYCFGHPGHFSLVFIKGSTILGQYYVDTLGANGMAAFCGRDYQNSFLINLKNWTSYIETN